MSVEQPFVVVPLHLRLGRHRAGPMIVFHELEGLVYGAPNLLSSAPLNGPIFLGFQGPKKGPNNYVKRAPN